MRMRTGVSAAVIAAALLLSAGEVRAEGPAPAAAPKPNAAAALPAKPSAAIFDVDRFFTHPSALGNAWARTVQAVLGEMRAFLDAEKAAARKVAAPLPPPKRRTLAWQIPSAATGEARLAPALIELRPVVTEPPTQAVADVRGERAVLLGAHFELPWSVP